MVLISWGGFDRRLRDVLSQQQCFENIIEVMQKKSLIIAIDMSELNMQFLHTGTQQSATYQISCNGYRLVSWTINFYPACCGLLILSDYKADIFITKYVIKEILKSRFLDYRMNLGQKCVLQCVCVKDRKNESWATYLHFEEALFELGTVLSRFRNPNTANILYVIEIRTHDYVNHIVDEIPHPSLREDE